MNEGNTVPAQQPQEAVKLQVKKSAPRKETPVIPLPVEKKLPVPPKKEFPVDSWIMPPEPSEYIQGRDNDCL